MKNLNKRLLKDLYVASEGLYTFTLYRRYNIPPKELFLAILELEAQCLITQERDRVNISETGRAFIIANKITVNAKKNKFETIPENFLGPKLEINEFYLPLYSDFKSNQVYSHHENLNGGINETSN